MIATLSISYFLCALLLVVYGLNCHVLTHLFLRRYPGRLEEDRALLRRFYGGPVPRAGGGPWAARLPVVTTQLPIFNEMNVVERLLEAVAAFDYPEGRHEIQVLDDSTDGTREIVARKVVALRARGVDIQHITRDRREGFKAGALRHGLARARGDVLAIFDADFLPPRDFLLRSVPFFLELPRVGFVQARWGHLNAGASLVTRFQSLGINGHFMVEQWARNTNGLFMNFNGTAGLFRRQAIEAAGNWHTDTLTEDMDLSYRVQLAGWDCRYLIDLEVPAEIPVDINAFKSQQFRWAKGSTQTAIKLLPRLLRSDARAMAKIQAALHMTHYLIHPLMLALALLAPVLLLTGRGFMPGPAFAAFGMLLLLSCTGPSRLYLAAERSLGRSCGRTLALLPLMICLGCGMAVSNSRAVIQALRGVPSGFIRTPKSGFQSRKRYRPAISRAYLVELAVGAWCAAGTILYFASRHYLIGHFMLVYAVGFMAMGLLTRHHQRKALAS